MRQLLIGTMVLVVSWYAMLATHETGHCLGALVTSARIESVRVPLIGFSRTTTAGGSCRLLVTWAGPVIGALLPLPLLLFFRRRLGLVRQILMFMAGFCLVANGTYIGLGAVGGVGDCRDLMQAGASLWQLLLYGVLASAGGLYVWHAMGPATDWFRTEAIAGTGNPGRTID